MAGIYELLKPGGNDNDERLDVHLVDSCFVAVQTGDMTVTEARKAIQGGLGRALVGAEVTDLLAINTQLSDAVGLDNKLKYNQIIMSAMILASKKDDDGNDVLNEASFRSMMGIT